jgi:hypothetical protein
MKYTKGDLIQFDGNLYLIVEYSKETNTYKTTLLTPKTKEDKANFVRHWSCAVIHHWGKKQ